MMSLEAISHAEPRAISLEEIECAIPSGELIEEYPKDKFGPKRHLYAIPEQGRILHVQCSVYLHHVLS